MAAINSNKSGNGQLPSGFISPFKRVPMEGTHDALLAIAATLTGKTMVDVRKMAVTLGMRANGAFYLDEVLFRKIIFNLSTLAVSDYKNLTSVSALPDVCVLCVDYSANDESSHAVLFHHVKGTPQQTAFSYIIDPATWVEPAKQITTDLSHLNLKPAWYLEISQRPNPNGKAK